MIKQYHILNGDALLDRINHLFQDEFIVCREALIEGPLGIENFNEKRANFLGVSVDEYNKISSSQFERIKSITENSEVNLWFEDDLFCQCNLWFVINLLLSIPLKANVYLVRPTSDSWIGFGSMDESQFAKAYQNRTLLSREQLLSFQNLWQLYSTESNDKLIQTARNLKSIIPRIENVVQAHLDRLAPNNRPLKTLRKIMEINDDKSFPAVFSEFSKQEGIYGFGDTSVKRMYNYINKEQ